MILIKQAVKQSDQSVSARKKAYKCLCIRSFYSVFQLCAAVNTALAFSVSASAGDVDVCPDQDADIWTSLLSEIPFSAALPIYVGGASVGGSNSEAKIPAGAARGTACSCNGDEYDPEYGIVTGLWEPAYLMEFTEVPGCSLVLGTDLPLGEYGIRGSSGTGNNDTGDVSFYNVHLYSFPLFTMLGIFSDLNCGRNDYADLDLLYASELDKAWNSEAYSLKVFPETSTLAVPAAIEACAEDASVAYSGVSASDPYWCAGAWGSLYPLSGWTSAHGGVATNTSLLSAKLLHMLHRRGLLRRTMGENALCGSIAEPIMDKTMYRFSMLYPVAETSSIHFLGEPVENWSGDARIPPGYGTVVYLVWRYRNCCLGAD